ncbi:hypothetical protein ACLOJK_040094 [Asimina triloba]
MSTPVYYQVTNQRDSPASASTCTCTCTTSPLPLKYIPEINGDIERQVGEQRLIDVENPDILAVAGDLHVLRVFQRESRDRLGIRRIPAPIHVRRHTADTPRRNLHPCSGVVRLHSESPAVAEDLVVVVRADVPVVVGGPEADETGTLQKYLKNRAGSSDDVEEEERGEDEEKRSAGIHCRKKKLRVCPELLLPADPIWSASNPDTYGSAGVGGRTKETKHTFSTLAELAERGMAKIPACRDHPTADI